MSSARASSLAWRITLFTRQNCSLCTTAKDVLSKVQVRKPFVLNTIDVMAPKNEKWKIYEFDVPVIHVERVNSDASKTMETSLTSKKLMHRFKEQEVEEIMNSLEKEFT